MNFRLFSEFIKRTIIVGNHITQVWYREGTNKIKVNFLFIYIILKKIFNSGTTSECITIYLHRIKI